MDVITLRYTLWRKARDEDGRPGYTILQTRWSKRTTKGMSIGGD
jgi:hypothetical protein